MQTKDKRWKGPRRGIRASVPPAFAVAIRSTAERYGLSITDLLQDLLSLELGRPAGVLTADDVEKLRHLPEVAPLLQTDLDWAPTSELVEIQGRLPKSLVDDVQRIAERHGSTIRFEVRTMLADAYGLQARTPLNVTGTRQRPRGVVRSSDQEVFVLSATG